MGRLDQVTTSSIKNPSVRYYTFKGKKDGFVYYDKETASEKVVTNLTFALLTVRNEVSGYHKKTKSSIWSNSVSQYDLGKVSFRVSSQKPDKNNNTLLAMGLWKEITLDVKKAGGHFTKVLYGYEEGVGIVKINLTGTSIEPFNKLEKETKNKKDLLTRFIGVVGTYKRDEEDDFTIPIFELGEVIDTNLSDQLDEAYDQLDQYLNQSRTGESEESRDNYTPDEEVGEEENDLAPIASDGLPF